MIKTKLIIIAHGWSSLVSDWDSIKDLLEKEGYLVVCISFPGLDDSTHIDLMKESAWGVPEYSEYVKNIIYSETRGLEFKEVIFIGHSFGGRIGIYLASQYPQIFTRMILTGSAGIKPKSTIKVRLLSFLAKVFKHLLFFPKTKDALGDYLRKRFTYGGYSRLDSLMRLVFQKVVNFDSKLDVLKIKVPTMLIWGGNDKVTPMWMAEYIHKSIENSSLKVIKDGGHNIFLTHQKEWLDKSELF